MFENEGTAPQAGGINATYSGWRGAIMVALNELMCWEQYYAVGGALRHVEFNPTPGTLNCADFPASVSTAPVQCMEISLYPAYNVLSKMLYPDPELRRDLMCIGGTSQWPATIFRGIDQWGERYGLGVPSNPVLVDKRDCQPIAPIVKPGSSGPIAKRCWLLDSSPRASTEGRCMTSMCCLSFRGCRTCR